MNDNLKEEKAKYLRTTILPKYNCSNCVHFRHKEKEIVQAKSLDGSAYAIECSNLTHPLEDCILRGFEGHSEQPGFSQTLNK